MVAEDRRIKTALICNMNNNLFSVARYLRDRRYDVTLLVLNTDPDHFFPANDTFDEDWKSYTTFVNWGDLASFTNLPREAIKDSIAKYDVLIGSGSAPAFVKKAGRRLDAFFPYGADLCELPFFRLNNFYPSSKYSRANFNAQIENWHFSNAQRNGIRSSRNIIFRQGQNQKFGYETYLKRIKSKVPVRSVNLPIIYEPVARQALAITAKQETSYHLALAKEFAKKMDAVIIHTTRHIWQNVKKEYSKKGNDVLLRGLADYVSRPNARRLGLIAMEYGPDFETSKNLCHHLGISDHVLWLPIAPRTTILSMHRYADIAAVEFKNSWTTGGVLWEGMVSGIPIMQFRDDALHMNVYPDLYPVMNVQKPKDFTNLMSDFFDNPQKYKNYGNAGLEWYKSVIVEPGLEVLEGIINKSA